MNGRRFDYPALDMPGVGRVTLLSRREDAVRLEAQDIAQAIVMARTAALTIRFLDRDVAGITEEPKFPQELSIWDGDRRVLSFRPDPTTPPGQPRRIIWTEYA